MFDKDTKVQVIQKDGYKKILRVGEVGVVDSVEGDTVSVKFEDGESFDYTAELLEQIVEKDELQQIEVAVFSTKDSEVKELSASTSDSRIPEAVMRAIELAICEAMDNGIRYDDISIVVTESEEGMAEREKLEGELKDELVGDISEDTKSKAKRAALIGIDVTKLEAESDEAKAVIDEATVVPPPIRLESLVGKEVIVELMGGGLYRGRLARGPWTANMFQVQNTAGIYKFSVKDVERILTK